MKFTLVFESNEAEDKCYGLVFVPSPIWVQGNREILNLDSQSFQLEPGCIRKLTELENIRNPEKCVIILHSNIGRATINDLDFLIEECRSMSLDYRVVSF